MAVPYILARTFEEAHAFAREEMGFGKGHYYVVTSPSTVKGIFGADLYLVPGWESRYDRFTMQSALRWTRLNKIDVAEMRAQAEESDLRYPDDERTHEIALRYNRLLAVPDGLEPAGEQLTLDGTEQEPVDPQPDEDPKAEEPKRRRRRCTECGILVDPDEVEQHAAEHFPSEA